MADRVARRSHEILGHEVRLWVFHCFVVIASLASTAKMVVLTLAFLLGKKVADNIVPIFQVAIDTAAPLEGDSSGGYMEPMDLYGAYGSMRSYGRFCGSLDYDVSTQILLCAHGA